jgi:hypothetical protein
MSEADLLQPDNIVRERWKIVSLPIVTPIKFHQNYFFRQVKLAAVDSVKYTKHLI